MQDNQLPKALLLTTMVTGVLLLLSFVPSFYVGDVKIKRVNLLADIAKDKPKPVAKVDTTKKIKLPPPIFRNDSCRQGITCIEDFSDNKKAMEGFVRAMQQVKKKPVRIAFFGDSFIEGDILAGNLRDTLQLLYGGRGVGYMPATSEVARFRNTIQHSFTNWNTYSFVGKKSPTVPLGTSGYCFIPRDDNEIAFKPSKRRFLNHFGTVRVFYTCTARDSLHYSINDSINYSVALDTVGSLQQYRFNAHSAQNLKINFQPYDSLQVYGLSFEDGNGVYVDNLSMRGNSGMGLLQVSNQMHRQFNVYQDYGLIILQYGLNVASEKAAGYDWYIDKMVKVVNNLKESFPKSSILIISVSDRSSNQDGEFATMPAIPLMRDAQREIARQSKVAFWDLFTAMGGENSMVKMAEAKPPLGAKDYTHLTYEGGKKLARLLAETILYERERYEPTKKKK